MDGYIFSSQLFYFLLYKFISLCYNTIYLEWFSNHINKCPSRLRIQCANPEAYIASKIKATNFTNKLSSFLSFLWNLI